MLEVEDERSESLHPGFVMLYDEVLTEECYGREVGRLVVKF